MIKPIRGRWARCEALFGDLDAMTCRAQAGAATYLAEARIAPSVSGLIRNGETLLVSGSLLTRCCVNRLRQTHLTIITNDLGLPAAVPSSYRVFTSWVGHTSRKCSRRQTRPWHCGQGFGVGGLEEALASSSAMALARGTIALAKGSAFERTVFA